LMRLCALGRGRNYGVPPHFVMYDLFLKEPCVAILSPGIDFLALLSAFSFFELRWGPLLPVLPAEDRY